LNRLFDTRDAYEVHRVEAAVVARWFEALGPANATCRPAFYSPIDADFDAKYVVETAVPRC
jgi:hypothetical protein